MFSSFLVRGWFFKHPCTNRIIIFCRERIQLGKGNCAREYRSTEWWHQRTTMFFFFVFNLKRFCVSPFHLNECRVLTRVRIVSIKAEINIISLVFSYLPMYSYVCQVWLSPRNLACSSLR